MSCCEYHPCVPRKHGIPRRREWTEAQCSKYRLITKCVPCTKPDSMHTTSSATSNVLRFTTSMRQLHPWSIDGSPEEQRTVFRVQRGSAT